MALAVVCGATAPCNDPPPIRRDRRGALINHNNPGPCQATGSSHRRTSPPMYNQTTAEAGRCSEHRTDAAPCCATALQEAA